MSCLFGFPYTGDPLLHTAMAVEVLGGRQDPCADDGSGHRHLFGNRKETKENVTARLFVGEPKVSYFAYENRT